MIIIAIVLIIMVFNMRTIARWSIEIKMTKLERAFSVLNTDIAQKCFRYVDKHGMLFYYPEEYIEEAVQAIRDNFEGEKEEMYVGILLGGFSREEYLSTHTFDEFYEAITEMDLALPEYYSVYVFSDYSSGNTYDKAIEASENNRSALTDENGEPLYYYEKVTYWGSLQYVYENSLYKRDY